MNWLGNLNTIAGGSNLSAVAFNLIQWAEARGRTRELVSAPTPIRAIRRSSRWMVGWKSKGWLQLGRDARRVAEPASAIPKICVQIHFDAKREMRLMTLSREEFNQLPRSPAGDISGPEELDLHGPDPNW
ncbi:MAG: hypothetical protein R2911_20035 [Caldilineaceae bacterium]